MLRVLVGNARRNLLTNARFPLMTEMHQIGRQMILLLLRQFRQLGFDLLQTHDQIIAGRQIGRKLRRSSGSWFFSATAIQISGVNTPSMSKVTIDCFTAAECFKRHRRCRVVHDRSAIMTGRSCLESRVITRSADL